MGQTENISAQRNLSALVDFGNLINSSLDIDFILSNLLLTCFGKFHTTKGIIAIKDNTGHLAVAAVKGFPHDSVLSLPHIKMDENACSDSAFTDFKTKYNLALCQKIYSTQELIGVIFLGQRLTKKDYTKDDGEFLNTLVNIAAIAIENSRTFGELKTANRELDSKVNMLTSLFELSKEFSGVLEINAIGKLLIYSVIGQFLVKDYAIITNESGQVNILASKLPAEILKDSLSEVQINEIQQSMLKENFSENMAPLAGLGVELVVPMQIHTQTRGLILLGKKLNKHNFTRYEIDYIYALGSLAAISIENARLFKEIIEKHKMEEELEIARKIQKNLFPQTKPVLKSFDIAALNVPSKQVGGDYYDIRPLDDSNTLIAIGDVSGKGIPASLLMANLQAFLKSISKQGMDLGRATDFLNDLVSENTVLGNFITFFWAILDDKNHTITYVNAGHNPPLLIRDGEIIKLTKGGMILGVIKTIMPYESEMVELLPGDTLVLFTDGITEAMNIENEEFTDERLECLAISNYTMTAEELMNFIKSEAHDHAGQAPQSDDITLMIIKTK